MSLRTILWYQLDNEFKLSGHTDYHLNIINHYEILKVDTKDLLQRAIWDIPVYNYWARYCVGNRIEPMHIHHAVSDGINYLLFEGTFKLLD